jgi:hypothetical protein
MRIGLQTVTDDADAVVLPLRRPDREPADVEMFTVNMSPMRAGCRNR